MKLASSGSARDAKAIAPDTEPGYSVYISELGGMDMALSIDSAGSLSGRTLDVSPFGLSPTEGHYRVAAFPADYAMTDDVILRDETGRAYLLSQEEEHPIPIAEDTANSLGMFFEPSQDSSWHTAAELRRIIYGVDDAVISIR